MRVVCCLCVCESPHQINFWMPEPILLNLVCTAYAYHGTWTHLSGVLHKYLPSVCVSVFVSLMCLLGIGSVKCIPPIVARQRPGKDAPAATNIRINTRRRIVRRVSSDLCIPPPLLGNNSVKKFPRQLRIVGNVVFYATRVVSKEIRRIVLPRTSCLMSNDHIK
jgi:hypothetical protein